MFQPIMSLRNRAEFYHRQLPQERRRSLNARGIPDTYIDWYGIGWDGKAITIPVEDRSGTVVFIKTAKQRINGSNPPKLKAPTEAPLELYPWKTLLRQPGRIIITERELDCLALEARGFPAVCSTGDLGTFGTDWIPHFEGVDHVYVCFGRDATSSRAAAKVAQRIPRAHIVRLPEAVGRGDIVDFFVRLGKTPTDLEKLLAEARSKTAAGGLESPALLKRSEKRAERLRKKIGIARVIGRYTTLRTSGERLFGRCPLHGGAEATLEVYPTTQTFHCSGCGAGGDVISFIEKAEHLTYGQALEALENIQYTDDWREAA